MFCLELKAGYFPLFISNALRCEGDFQEIHYLNIHKSLYFSRVSVKASSWIID